MKPKQTYSAPVAVPAAELNDKAISDAVSEQPEAMVRTQVYLTPAEHHFLQAEARRRNEPMAAVLRSIVDEKMRVPDDAWTNNPMLRPTPKDPRFDLPEDAAINHDHYLYGTPKKYVKVKGQWVAAEEKRS
jgi:hypothetical protein